MKWLNKLFYYPIALLYLITYNTVHFLQKDSVERNKAFLPRLYGLGWVLFIFYIYYSHLYDFMLAFPQNISGGDGGISYFEMWQRKRILKFFKGLFLVYLIYYILSLFIFPLYRFLGRAVTTTSILVYQYIFHFYYIFAEMEIYWWCWTTKWTALCYYMFIMGGFIGHEWAVDMEEEYDDPAMNVSELARADGTTIQTDLWFDDQNEEAETDKTRLMTWEMSRVTSSDTLMSEVFGNQDDLGENPELVAVRVEKHNRKMYPDYYAEPNSEEAAYLDFQEEYQRTPDEYEWLYVVHVQDPMSYLNFYSEFVYEYVEAYWEPIKPYFTLLNSLRYLRLYCFRPKVVGLYSFYASRLATSKKWKASKIYKRFEVRKRIWAQTKFYIIKYFTGFFRFFSISRIKNNRKWKKFHFKYYVSILKLRRRRTRSNNYEFFKPKKI